MAKDPAFLFYPNDYIGGTMGMTLEEKGAYMELLILQFNKGAFTINQAKKLLNGSFEKLWPVFAEKFTEKEGKFFNKRLEKEKQRRQNFIKNQSLKGKKSWESRKKDDNRGNNHGSNQIQTYTIGASNKENETLNEIKEKGVKGEREETQPPLQEVERVFIQQGGTKEMALTFFNRYEAVQWRIRGSPVRDFSKLVGSFISNWKKNEQPYLKIDQMPISAPLKRLN
jgi:uncharacterized protein YdaU (DUF1376 family)